MHSFRYVNIFTHLHEFMRTFSTQKIQRTLIYMHIHTHIHVELCSHARMLMSLWTRAHVHAGVCGVCLCYTGLGHTGERTSERERAREREREPERERERARERESDGNSGGNGRGNPDREREIEGARDSEGRRERVSATESKIE